MLIQIDSDVFLYFLLVCSLTHQILPGSSREVKPRACHKLCCESKGAPQPERLNHLESFPFHSFSIQNYQQNVIHYWISPQLANVKIKLLSKYYWAGLHAWVVMDLMPCSEIGSHMLTLHQVANRVECSSQQLCAEALESKNVLTRFQDFKGGTLGTTRAWVASLRVYSSCEIARTRRATINDLQI